MQEMVPCCGCLRIVLEARDSLASTGALFLCAPGATKRDETSEVSQQAESLVVFCLIGINEKRGQGGGHARPKCWSGNEGKACVHSKTNVPCRPEVLRDAANKMDPRVPKSQLARDSRSRPVSRGRGRRCGISEPRRVNMSLGAYRDVTDSPAPGSR